VSARPPTPPPATPSGFPLFVGALVVLAPPAIVAWVAAALLLRLGRVRRWHLAAIAAVSLAGTVAAGGVSAALGRTSGSPSTWGAATSVPAF